MEGETAQTTPAGSEVQATPEAAQQTADTQTQEQIDYFYDPAQIKDERLRSPYQEMQRAYTQKTQRAASAWKEAEEVKSQLSAVLTQLQQPEQTPPLNGEGEFAALPPEVTKRLDSMESMLKSISEAREDAALEREISTLQEKFKGVVAPDFISGDLLDFAGEHRIANLEHALYAMMGPKLMSRVADRTKERLTKEIEAKKAAATEPAGAGGGDKTQPVDAKKLSGNALNDVLAARIKGLVSQER